MKKEFENTSPGTSEYLQLLGVKRKSENMYRYNAASKQYQIIPSAKTLPGTGNLMHCYSIAELGLMIPWGFFQSSSIQKLPGGIWQITKKDGQIRNFALEVEARCWFLIDLILSKEITVFDVNNPVLTNQPFVAPKIN